MHTPSIPLLAVLLLHAWAGTAQSDFQNDMATDASRRSAAAALMNITFADATAGNCGHDNDTAASSSALTIAIRTIPQDRVCFNLGNTFSRPDATYSVKGNACAKNTICGVNYTITAAGFRPDVTYSSVYYTQIRNPFAAGNGDEGKREDEDGDKEEEEENGRRTTGRLQFATYNGANCHEKDDVESLEWNCISSLRGECNRLPYAVQSFSIEMTDPEDVGNSNCSVALKSGAGRTSGGIGPALMVALWATLLAV